MHFKSHLSLHFDSIDLNRLCCGLCVIYAQVHARGIQTAEMEMLQELSALYWNSSLQNDYANNSNVTNHTVSLLSLLPASLPVAAALTAYLFTFCFCWHGGKRLGLSDCVGEPADENGHQPLHLNLAVSDLLVGVFCIPTTLVDNLITGNTHRKNE